MHSKVNGPVQSRRAFLKTLGAAAGSIGLAGSLSGCVGESTLLTSAKPISQQEQVYSGACRAGCAQGCYLNFHVREGKVVRTSARDFVDPDYNRICAKGLSMPGRIYDPNRVKYPMRRVGERGSGQWERISWEEAMSEIGECVNRNVAEYGPLSIGHAFRTGQEGIVFQMVWNRFRKALGGAVMRMAADRHFAKGLIDTIGYGGLGSTNDDKDLAKAKCILILGSSFTETFYQQWHWVYEAQRNGAKIIVIDPHFNGIAAKADMWVPIRPATDVVLFNALINIVIENKWVDWDFMRRQTCAPCLVRSDNGAFLRMGDLNGDSEDERLVAIESSTGEAVAIDDVQDPVLQDYEGEVGGFQVRSPWNILVEGIAQYTPEVASEMCDIPEETIYEIARIFATEGPSSIKIGLGPDHRFYGYEAYLAQATLSIITGNLAKEGATNGYFSRKPGYNSDKMGLPAGMKALNKSYSIAASQFANFMETGKYGDLDIPMKVLFSEGTDFVHMRGDRQKTIEALDKLDLLVSVNLVMNDTSLVADIVLPVAEWCEYEEIGGNRSYTCFLQYQEKVQEPMYECKTDLEIVKMLFDAIGHPEYFNWNSSEDVLREYFGDELYEKIRDEKVIYAPYFVERNYSYIYGADGKWDTTSGKAQFYTEKPSHGIEYVSYNQPDNPEHSRYPQFFLPDEAWNEGTKDYPKFDLAEKYPLSIMAEHKKWNSQTCYSRSPIIRELDPEPTIYMSEKDAADRGISEGDYVRAFSDRGEVVLLCHINRGMRPGMVNMPNGWLADQYVKGSEIDVSNDRCDPDNENCNFEDALVEVEKYDGEVVR